MAAISRKIINSKQATCKLTTAELQQRKASVIASLKKQVLERKELKNGYRYKFNGSDAVIDELTNFIKSERMCCDFFTFHITVSGDSSEAWLEITGENGAKRIMETEIQI